MGEDREIGSRGEQGGSSGVFCIRGGRGKSGRNGRKQEKLSNNAKYSVIQGARRLNP